MPRYQAAVFDLDGTVLNTDLYIVADYLHMFQKYAPDKMPSLKEMIYFSGPTLEEVFPKYFPGYDMQELIDEYHDFCQKYANSLSCLYPGEIETLEELKAAGIKLGLATNKGEKGTASALSYFGLSKYFDSVFPYERCVKHKPDPWPLLACAKELQVKPEETLYIGDDNGDISAGRNAKMDVGLVLFGLKKLPKGLKPDYRFKTFMEIRRKIIDGKRK